MAIDYFLFYLNPALSPRQIDHGQNYLRGQMTTRPVWKRTELHQQVATNFRLTTCQYLRKYRYQSSQYEGLNFSSDLIGCIRHGKPSGSW